jgi:soluble lytic murein transglycosylase-like protein
MKNATVLAAAFAAGLITFAANAQEGATQAAMMAPTSSIDIGAQTPATKKAEEPPRGLTAEEVHHAIKVAEKDFAAAAKNSPAERYKAIVDRYASENGVSRALAHAVVTVESNYKPYSLGRAGEVGLMQIKPATARLMGYAGTPTGLFDPETNIKYGMKYLGKAQKLGDGTTCGTILKYNAGHGAKRMNPISRNYCAKVKRHLATGGTPKFILASNRGV